MTKEIINDIDKLDGMVKIKGKCGYEIIGGCSELRRLKQENEELKNDLKAETELAQKWYQLETDKHFLALKYYKALEEIRKETEKLLYEQNPIFGYNNSNYFELLSKFILNKTQEVLNG